MPGANDTAYVGNGGTLSIMSSANATALDLGQLSGTATVLLGAAVPLNTTFEYIGDKNTASFAQSSGSNTAVNIYLGYASAGNGSYGLSGGNLSATILYDGYSGAGSFIQSGGTIANVILLDLGANAGSRGNYTLSGGSLSTGAQAIGFSGTGSFVQNGVTNSVNGNLNLGLNTASSGSYTLTNGSLNVSLMLYVGNSGAGTFTQSGGTTVVGQNLIIAGNTASSGNFNLSGSASSFTAAREYVGLSAGAPAMFQQVGATNTTAILAIGNSGTYVCNGGTINIANGFSCAGTFDAQNSAAVLNFAGSAIVDLSHGNILNTGSTALSVGPNSLLIYSTSTSPYTQFGAFSSAGIVHALGTTLTVAARTRFWRQRNDNRSG